MCDKIRDHHNMANILKLSSTLSQPSILLTKGASHFTHITIAYIVVVFIIIISTIIILTIIIIIIIIVFVVIIVVSILPTMQRTILIHSPGCVDAWSWKVLEEAQGCHVSNLEGLRVDCDWSTIDALVPNGSRVFVADSNGDLKKKNDSSTPPLTMTSPTDPPTMASSNSPEYTDVSYVSAHVTLVLGGETEGVSEEGRMFCEERGGCGVHIGMRRGVESLNSGVSLAILLHEVTRQQSAILA